MPTPLEKALEKQRKIDERVRTLQARDRAKERKADTRRKILIGGVIMARIKRGEWPEDKLRSMLDKELKENRDRVLFDLPPLAPPADGSNPEQDGSKPPTAAPAATSPQPAAPAAPSLPSAPPVERRKRERRQKNAAPPEGIDRRNGERRKLGGKKPQV